GAARPCGASELSDLACGMLDGRRGVFDGHAAARRGAGAEGDDLCDGYELCVADACPGRVVSIGPDAALYPKLYPIGRSLSVLGLLFHRSGAGAVRSIASEEHRLRPS